MSLQRAGLLHAFTRAPTYVLELGDLAGPMRLLALAACICLNVFDAPTP